jgi:hypothetical protein
MITIDCDTLRLLLEKVRRPQTIAGKQQDQVHSCILVPENNKVKVVSLVKDGVTSLNRFSCFATCKVGDKEIPITNIKDFLGILKYHGGSLSLSWINNKVKVKSKSKQTTITGSTKATAYPHNPATLMEWTTKSLGIARSFVKEDNYYHYVTSTGEKITPFYTHTTDGNTMFEALRCDSMNNQKINRYTFIVHEGGFLVETGNELKGKTTYILQSNTSYVDNDPIENWRATFEGGLDNLFSHVNGSITLNFYRFPEQGIKMLIDFGSGDFVFQASIIGE